MSKSNDFAQHRKKCRQIVTVYLFTRKKSNIEIIHSILKRVTLHSLHNYYVELLVSHKKQ